MKNRTAHSGRTKLDAIVRAYIGRIRPRAQAELDWFAHQPSLDSAIEKAALAVNSRGKRYSHQRRARALGLNHSTATLEVSALPKEFRTLEAHELEDVLCIFKDELKNTASLVPSARGIIKRSCCD